MERIDENGKWVIDGMLAILVEPSDTWIARNQNNTVEELIINQDLVDAYEAIASLYEMNRDLQTRLEVIENGNI